jgi:hypothetical protein
MRCEGIFVQPRHANQPIRTSSVSQTEPSIHQLDVGGDQPDADGVPARHEPVAVVLDLVIERNWED